MTKLGKNAAGNLKGHVDAIEALETDKRDLGKDIRGIYTKAKADGFSRPALRATVARRRKGKQKCTDEDALIKTYEQALGLTPLEVAAAGGDEAGDDEAGDDEAGDDEAGDDETGDDEAGDDETGDQETGNQETGDGETVVDFPAAPA